MVHPKNDQFCDENNKVSIGGSDLISKPPQCLSFCGIAIHTAVNAVEAWEKGGLARVGIQ